MDILKKAAEGFRSLLSTAYYFDVARKNSNLDRYRIGNQDNTIRI